MQEVMDSPDTPSLQPFVDFEWALPKAAGRRLPVFT